MNIDGPVSTAARGKRVVEDKKINIVVSELRRYEIEVAGFQESKWFGKDIFRVEDAIVLTSGRAIPTDDFKRGEGVGVVLRGRAQQAFVAGGNQWSAVSSRVARCKLKFGDIWVHVVVCYAPTFRSSRDAKNDFFDSLQEVILSVPTQDSLIILGDFNARVGAEICDDGWYGTRGPHGVGTVNEAGAELLQFLACNSLTVCNTWFMKRNIHKCTWQHPRSKRWHCIDYAMVREQDLSNCTDCHVIRGAECSTDHNLVCLTYRIRSSACHKRAKRPVKFDVQQLVKHSCMTEAQRAATCKTREQYATSVASELRSWNHDGCVEDKWSAVKSAIVTSAEKHLGRPRRRQPDWFEACADVLAPMLDSRNALHRKWLASGSDADRRRFVEARGKCRTAVRNAKSEWIGRKANVVESSRFSGKHAWSAIRDIQKCYSGLSPISIPSIRDSDGVICSSQEGQEKCWLQHFARLLNVRSTFDATIFDHIEQREVDESLGQLPSLEDLTMAIRQLANCKAPGSSGIAPELLKAGDTPLLEALLDVIHTAWTNGTVPQDWRDAQLVPIPKKGDLTNCNNWRGIALLDVAGKVCGRLIQDRLQLVAEQELPESQCGFRPGRGCADAIFSIRQLIEKSYEHRQKLFCVFVDLKKAYDSVPRQALWLALGRLGIPEGLLNLIQSFHESMQAAVRVGASTTEPFAVNNGLRQGCVMAPVLFNLYFGVVLERWAQVMQDSDHPPGIPIQFSINGNLFSKPARQSTAAIINDIEYADDAVLLAEDRPGAEKCLETFCTVASSFGLCVNAAKTKFLVAGSQVNMPDRADMNVNGDTVEHVPSFIYLGSVVTPDARSSTDVSRRIAEASKAFGALLPVLSDRSLSLVSKRKLYVACVLSILLYGSECWTPLKADSRRLDAFHHRCIRTILAIPRSQQQSDRITSAQLRRHWGDPVPLSVKMRHRRLEWLGHVARMSEDRVPLQLLFGRLLAARPFCGPRRRWRDVVATDTKSIPNWFDCAQDRSAWREQVLVFQPPRAVEKSVLCSSCNRAFSRPQDKARHKCLAERQLPVHQQRGSAQCVSCCRWFRSKGGLAVHRCQPALPEHADTALTASLASCCFQHCQRCNRCFKSRAGFNRHNCNRGKRLAAADRESLPLICMHCPKRFRRQQDLTRHQKSCQ